MSNPIGNYNRIKTWGSADTILGSDLNDEFDNILVNFNPEMLAGYSQNQAEMQTQTAPGSVGSESLATSLSGELERLRYQISAITGNTYWYSTPAASLSQINSLIGAVAFGNRINSGFTTGTTGSTQPMFLLAANTTNTVTLKATTTPFSYQISGTTYSIAVDTPLTGLTVAPSSQNTATVTDLTLAQAGTASTQMLGENGSQITVASMGTNVSALQGNIAAFKTTAGEYLLGRVASTTQIKNVYRGYFFNSSNVLVSRGTLSSGDTLTLQKLAWIYATTAGGLAVGYTNPRSSGIAPTSPASNDYWYNTSLNYWKIYNGTSWVQANVTLIGIAITDTANTVATRSFDFFENFQDLNTCELFADQQNSGTVVRTRNLNAQLSVYGSVISYNYDYARWDFSTDLDTSTQAASTTYYFYVDMNGRSWISKTAPHDRRGDLHGYYHPGLPWRCLGYGWSNSGTLVENVESFYVSDDSRNTSNITASSNVILPYNIVPREQVIALSGASSGFTQVIPPPSQWRGKYITYVRTDNTLANVITLQSWGTAALVATGGTLSLSSNTTTISGLSGTAGIVAGQLIHGTGIVPNTTVSSVPSSSTVVMSNAAIGATTTGTYTFANAAGYAGTVGNQTNYLNYGISGKFSVPMCTQNESWTFFSDGFSVFIAGHYCNYDFQSSLTFAVGTAGFGTATNQFQSCKRLEDKLVGKLFFTVGSIAAAAATLTLPTSLTIDTNNMPATSLRYAVGTYWAFQAGQWGSNNLFGLMSVDTATPTIIYFSLSGSSNQFVKTNGSTVTNGANGIYVEYAIPIVNWLP